MAIYTIGEVVKRERLSQGITQEALAENICSTSWLSKIESGVKTPTPQVFELLMHRLGKSVSQFVLFRSDKEMELSNLKQKINACYRTQKIIEGREALSSFIALRDEKNSVDVQYELLYTTLLYEGELSLETEHEMLNKALALTLPEFDENQIMDYLLSIDEIMIINSISDIYRRKGDIAQAISLLKKILSFLERPKFDHEEKRRIYSSVIFNIATLCGFTGNHVECIYYSDKGIDYSIANNIMRTIPKLLYSKGCSLASMGNLKEAHQCLTQAYHMFRATKVNHRADHLKIKAKDNWDLTID